jgi:biotin carboxylase
MWALGDKIASSIVAQTAGVPTIPWTGTGLKVAWTEEDLRRGKVVTVPRHVYDEAVIKTVEDGLAVRFSFFGFLIFSFL